MKATNVPIPEVQEASSFGFPKVKMVTDRSVGICIGASTITVVALGIGNDGLEVVQTESVSLTGNPFVTAENLLRNHIDKKTAVAVTGRNSRTKLDLTSISESEATEYALVLLKDKVEGVDGVVSLGAENFILYELTEDLKIRKQISENQCASGTGEFFKQQIKRMDIDITEAANITPNGSSYSVSGRCSVFCKSDCTHALNKGIPKNKIVLGLAEMMTEKVDHLIGKSKVSNLMVVGGISKNQTVVDLLKRNYKQLKLLPESIYFEALGAAVYAISNKVKEYDPADALKFDDSIPFTFHKPLNDYLSKVKFCETSEALPQSGDNVIVGLDVGSTTTKGVIVRRSDKAILGKEYLYTNGNPIEASREVYRSLLKHSGDNINIAGIGITGSGRYISGLFSGSKAIYNEITAHARAAVHFDAEVDTIFEIGGQDAKYMFINNRVPSDYAMNEACSAGTGSFIQEATFESLGMELHEIEKAALQAENPVNFRDQCSALIGSDIKRAIQEGINNPDIVAGLTYSICLNYINRVKAKRPVGSKIYMQGGVCYNKAIPIAMAAITDSEIIVPPLPGLMGAYGAAIKTMEDIELGNLDKDDFDLGSIISRDISIKKSFECKDQSNGCNRSCEINVFSVDSKLVPFGGSCNKYYSALRKSESQKQNSDIVSQRIEQVFDQNHLLSTAATTIGINRSFTQNRIYPLYHTFFTELGFNVITSDVTKKEVPKNLYSSFCYPVELAHASFADLLEKKPDIVFMPEIYEMHVPGFENDMKDSNATCVFISKEANILIQSFKGQVSERRFLHPYMNFARGYDSQTDVFVELGKNLGINDREKVVSAYMNGVKKVQEVHAELKMSGEKFMKDLQKSPDEHAFVIFGRDYNAFDDNANMGIPNKLASLGYKVVPYDILDFEDEKLDTYQSWEAGKKILRAAKMVKKHPQLYPVFITNFSCGPDSMIIPLFRDIMGNKPSLTLELDQHTADAGINTRIDAFIDVVNNYKKITQAEPEIEKEFVAAKIVSDNGKIYYRDSKGKLSELKDSNTRILIPAMGHMVSRFLAASMRSLGFDAVALPEMSTDDVNQGLKNTSGKECLPIILSAGSLLNNIEKHLSSGKKIAFMMIGGTSACRVSQYSVLLEKLIHSKRIENLAVLTLASENGYVDLGQGFLNRSIKAIILNDILEDMQSGILANAADSTEGMKVFEEEVKQLEVKLENDFGKLKDALKIMSANIAEKVPYRNRVCGSKYIALTGEIFIRHNQFAHNRLNHFFGKHGFILKDSYISEWIKYIDYAWRNSVFTPDISFLDKLRRLIREQLIGSVERSYKKVLAKTGYIERKRVSVIKIVKHSLFALPLESTGEPALTLGTALAYGYEKFAGIINVGPFGCLQTRIAEAICTPNMNLGVKQKVKNNLKIPYRIPNHLNRSTDIPFLTIECDGKGFPQIIESRLETFLLQIRRASYDMRKSS